MSAIAKHEVVEVPKTLTSPGTWPGLFEQGVAPLRRKPPSLDYLHRVVEPDNRLEDGLLTTLIDSEAALATLLARLLDLELDPETPVSEVLRVLDRLEQGGLVKVGIWTSGSKIGEPPRAPTLDELRQERARYRTLRDAADEVWPFIGLWYRLTPLGRDRWVDHIGARPLPEQSWRIAESRGEQTLVIEAQSDAIAEHALAIWKRQNPERKLALANKEKTVSFTLRDGTAVENGVRRTYREVD